MSGRRVPRGACVLALLLLASPITAESDDLASVPASSSPPVPAGISPDGTVSLPRSSPADPSPAPLTEAEQLWAEAEHLRSTGRGRDALPLYRRAADAPGALPARASALATLARMHEFGWDGASDLISFTPPASSSVNVGGTGEAALLRATGRLLPRALTHTLTTLMNALTPATGDGSASLTTLRYGRELLVPPNMTAAVALYNASATWGNATAQMTMATLYATGLYGVPHDDARALLFEYFAATGGNVEAVLALGVRHATGIAAPSSCAAAVSYFETAAHSVARAVHEAHDMVAGGNGFKSAVALDEDALDDVQVKPAPGSTDANLLALYHHAADKGEMNAHVLLGHLYFLGAHGVARDYVLASEHFHAAAENDDVMSITNLGIMYYFGLGVAKDDALAHVFITKAVEKESAAALNLMGVWHTRGLGSFVQVDMRAAFELFQRAAAHQFMDAHYNLALMHLHGTAPSGRDFRAAYAHLAAAAQQGHIKALYRVGLMHLHGIGTGVDCGSAQRAFRNAVQRMNISPALDNAYNLVAVGNIPAAVLQYARAAELGQDIGYSNAAALIELGLLPPAVADPHGSETEPVPTPPRPTKGGGFLFELASRLLPHPGMRTTPALQRRVLRMRTRSTVYVNGAAELSLGDAHFYGHGGLNVSFARAAERYQAACNLRVPQACWNMGYMHEYGLGVTRDAHLAKRFYDLCLEHQNGRREPAPVPVQLALARMAASRGWDWFFVTYGRRWAHASGFQEFGSWLHSFGQWVLSAAPHTVSDGEAAPTAAPAAAAKASTPAPTVALVVSATPSTDASESSASADAPTPVAATPTPQPDDLIAAALQRAKAARAQRQQAESISNAALNLMHEAVPLVSSVWSAFSTASHTLVTALASVTSGGRAATRFSKEDSTILVLCIVLGAVLFLRVNFRRRRAGPNEAAAPPVQPPPQAAAAAA